MPLDSTGNGLPHSPRLPGCTTVFLLPTLVKKLTPPKNCWIWHWRCDRQKFLSFWVIFCPFSSLTSSKIKISKLKKHLEILWFYTFAPYKWQLYYVWFLKYGVRQTSFFVILNHFLPFYPPMDPENQNFEKMKKTPEDIILQMCTINDNLMMYGSWNVECDRQNFLSFWTIFCTFALLTIQKIKILKNEKITWIYYHFSHENHKW